MQRPKNPLLAFLFIVALLLPWLIFLFLLDTGRMVVGYIAMLILILILAPMPHSLWDSASDVCPYL